MVGVEVGLLTQIQKLYVSKDKTTSFDDTFLSTVVKLLDLDHKIEKV